MRHTLGKTGVHCQAWDRWVVAGRTVHKGADPGAAETLADAVVTPRWRRRCMHRAVRQGLSEGRDEEIMHLVSGAYRRSITKGMLWSIQSDNVYTPARAFQYSQY